MTALSSTGVSGRCSMSLLFLEGHPGWARLCSLPFRRCRDPKEPLRRRILTSGSVINQCFVPSLGLVGTAVVNLPWLLLFVFVVTHTRGTCKDSRVAQ